MSRAMFLVVRRAVKVDGTGCDDQNCHDTGSRVPLRLFADRPAAEQFVVALTAEARRTMNPFLLVDGYLSADERKRLAGFGLPVACPADDWHGDWAEWWDRCADLSTDEQRAAVWALFGQLSPYEVVEIEINE
jgi:hypothetical protein